ncbi:Fanconi anemia group M protein [Eudromia elegans]
MRGSWRQSALPQAWRAPRGAQEAADEELLAAAEAAEAPGAAPGGDAAPGPGAGGFCTAAGALWIYPTNYPVRGYQLRMAGAALLANTLVCLPTGLGKTFVAAVVMYNFYRWFPSGKVLFLAPTKPLVAQQMEACARLMGIPPRHMAEMTGGTQVLSRRELWATRRVFFLTPQIMVNDLSRGTCPAVEIKCLVIDEAHKALGNHAYCQVVKELSKYTNQFRILALSATPGSDAKAVQQVISNLLIAKIELCSEDSPEIQPYSHERRVEKIVVPLGKELVEIQNAYIRVLEAFAGRLIKIGVLARREIPSLTKYQIILARDQFRKNPSSQNAGILQGTIEGDFALCISLYHGYELLLQMGLRSLFIYFCGIMDGSKGLTRTRNELGRNEDFMKLYQQLRDMFADTSLTSANGSPHKDRPVSENKKEFIYSHPKLRKLEEIVVKHFESWKQGCSGQSTAESESMDTRVMIFSSFRDSVQEIAEMLSRLRPVVRVMTFVGHSTGKSTRGFTQKEQLEVVKRFREGGYNTLVSTCVGEEGLDIGEVDLIICFDAQKSPIRLVQRMGRTGRKRQGRIVVILAEGREERTYNQSQSNKRSIHKAIVENKTLHFYQHSPRMIPEGINPKLHKMFITTEKYEPDSSRVLCKERRSSSLQNKSALFSCVTGTKETHSHENWSLSSEEFEIWDRIYRLKESDGVKELKLPQIQFETIENLEEMPKPKEEGTRELSLCEWRIWQNRPFPTFMVEHSDRCRGFISVMELIELLRHEKGACSYEQELQPYLRVEDVNVQRNRSPFSKPSSAFDQKAQSARKTLVHRAKAKALLPYINDTETELISDFKITNTKTLRTLGLNSEVPAVPTETCALDSFTARGLPLHENADQGSQEDDEIEKVTFDLNEFTDLSDSCESTINHESALIKEGKSVDKAFSSVGTNHVDSGYGSFTVEKSPVSSGLFYLPESHLDSFAPVTSSEESPWLKGVFSSVQRLLSQSPPPLSKLDDIESSMGSGEAAICPFQNAAPSSSSDRLQHKVSSASSGANHSPQPLENPPALRVTPGLCVSVKSCLAKTASPSEAAVGEAEEELHWSDSFDGVFDSEELMEIPQKTLTINHTPANNPSKRCSIRQEREDLPINEKKVVTDEEKSIHLFEDEHIYDTNGDLFAACAKNSAVSNGGKAGPRAAPGEASKGALSTGHCADTHSSCWELPTSPEVTTTEAPGDTSVTDQHLHDDGLCDCSQELFSVTFDLGFSIEESENESLEEDANANNVQKATGGDCADVKSAQEKLLNENSRLQTPPRWECQRTSSDSEEEVVIHVKNRKKENVLKSPDVMNDSDFESPIHAIRKRRHPLNMSDVSSDDSMGLHKSPGRTPRSRGAACREKQLRSAKRQKVKSSFTREDAARQFLEEEAELSQQDADCVSSDESDDSDSELNSSLAQFLNDDSEFTQVLNESEMKGVYLESVRSPALGNRYKMVHREFNSRAIFSQIPEQDEAYAEDSFCVGEEQEETCHRSGSSEEEVRADFDLLIEESFAKGRKQYLTRRRRKLNQARVGEGSAAAVPKKKPSRIIVLDDSSGEETSVREEQPPGRGCGGTEQGGAQLPRALPSVPAAQRKQVAGISACQAPENKGQMLLSLKASVSETLDFHPESRVRSGCSSSTSFDSRKEDFGAPAEVERCSRNVRTTPSAASCPASREPPPAASLEPLEGRAALCVLVDSREISSGPDVISALKAAHGLRVHVCPLSSSDYVVSNRMAVERKFQSELLNSANRTKVVQRIQRLQSIFERICVIVEKDRVKAGETSRFFQRTQYYDGVLSALVQAGIRILFSSCQEETAALLKDLALLEQRKNAAILVPAEVEGHRQEMLNFYLSIPNISYLAALNLCHSFDSVKKMANSSPQDVAAAAHVSQQKGEEIVCYLRYAFDVQMLPQTLRPKAKS